MNVFEFLAKVSDLFGYTHWCDLSPDQISGLKDIYDDLNAQFYREGYYAKDDDEEDDEDF